jgi:drug/metabolite transporter (DMT)-like permease
VSPKGWLLFAAMSVIWGIPYLFIKVAIEDLSPDVLVFLRCGLAALLLLPLAAFRRELGPALARWRWLLLFAVVEIAVPFIMLGVAETRLSSSLTGLLIAAVPLLGAVIAGLFRLDDSLDRGRLLGLLVGFAGVATLVGLDVRGGDLWSVGAVLVAALGYAVGPMIVTARLQGVPTFASSALAMAATAVVYLPFALWHRPAVPAVPGRVWIAVLVLGAVCSALAFLIFFALIAEVGPARATVITYVNPAVALLLGIAVLDERLTVGIVVGFALVLFGCWLATRRSAPGRREQSGTREDARENVPAGSAGRRKAWRPQ